MSEEKKIDQKEEEVDSEEEDVLGITEEGWKGVCSDFLLFMFTQGTKEEMDASCRALLDLSSSFFGCVIRGEGDKKLIKITSTPLLTLVFLSSSFPSLEELKSIPQLSTSRSIRRGKNGWRGMWKDLKGDDEGRTGEQSLSCLQLVFEFISSKFGKNEQLNQHLSILFSSILGASLSLLSKIDGGNERSYLPSSLRINVAAISGMVTKISEDGNYLESLETTIYPQFASSIRKLDKSSHLRSALIDILPSNYDIPNSPQQQSKSEDTVDELTREEIVSHLNAFSTSFAEQKSSIIFPSPPPPTNIQVLLSSCVPSMFINRPTTTTLFSSMMASCEISTHGDHSQEISFLSQSLSRSISFIVSKTILSNNSFFVNDCPSFLPVLTCPLTVEEMGRVVESLGELGDIVIGGSETDDTEDEDMALEPIHVISNVISSSVSLSVDSVPLYLSLYFTSLTHLSLLQLSKTSHQPSQFGDKELHSFDLVADIYNFFLQSQTQL